MSVKTLDAGAEWVDRLVALCEVEWTASLLEARFAVWGWPADPAPEWGAGAAEPYFHSDPDAGPLGPWLELGPPPPHPDAAVVLPCALGWPAFGEDPEEGDEDDLDADYGPAWRRIPDGGLAAFHAERDRLRGLVEERLGAPDGVVTGDDDAFRAVWRHGDRAVVLFTTDDLNSYSHYQLLALGVSGAGASLVTGAVG